MSYSFLVMACTSDYKISSIFVFNLLACPRSSNQQFCQFTLATSKFPLRKIWKCRESNPDNLFQLLYYSKWSSYRKVSRTQLKSTQSRKKDTRSITLRVYSPPCQRRRNQLTDQNESVDGK